MSVGFAVLAASFGILLSTSVRALPEPQVSPAQQRALAAVAAQRQWCLRPATADSMYAVLGQALATETDSAVRAYMYRNRFLAARTLDHPDSMRAAADSAVLFLPWDQVVLHQFASYLGERHVQLDVAEDYAHRALLRYGRDEPTDRGDALTSLAYVQCLRGEYELSIPTLQELVDMPTRHAQWGLLCLGRAYRRTGRRQESGEALIRCAAKFQGDSTIASLARESLDSLALEQPSVTQNLDERIANARIASRRHELFESRRDGRRVRIFRMFDLRDSTMRTVDFRHGLAVVDVWGTWCGPCRTVLPTLEPFASHYARKPVRFLALSVEFDGPAKARERVLQLLSDNSYMHEAFLGDSAVVSALAIASYPTTLVIRDGVIEYRNLGESHVALEAQLAELLAPKSEGARTAAGAASRRR